MKPSCLPWYDLLWRAHVHLASANVTIIGETERRRGIRVCTATWAPRAWLVAPHLSGCVAEIVVWRSPPCFNLTSGSRLLCVAKLAQVYGMDVAHVRGRNILMR